MEFRDFVHPKQEKKELRSPETLLKKVVLASIRDFSEEDREYIRDYVEGNWLTPYERSEVEHILRDWWKKSFDANFDDILSRNKILNGLEESPETDLQERYLEHVRFGLSEEENKKLKEQFIAKFPDQIQGIELLFGLKSTLESQIYLNENRTRTKLAEVQSDIVGIVEYTNTLINFVQANRDDKEFLKVFWSILEEIAESSGYKKEYGGLKSGVLSHIGAHQVAEKLQLKPRTSKPTEDALRGIDEYGRHGEILQYKTKDSLRILRGEVSLDEKKNLNGVFEMMNGLKVFNEFREKMKKTIKTGNKRMQVFYFIEVPGGKINEVNGDLAKEILDEVSRDSVQNIDRVIEKEILEKEAILRNEIVQGTREYYGKKGGIFDETHDPYTLTDKEYKILLRQCLLNNLYLTPVESKSVIYPFIFSGEERDVNVLYRGIEKMWDQLPNSPHFDNRVEVGDYLFRRYLRDVDYGWKKRDMAGSTGFSTGK